MKNVVQHNNSKNVQLKITNWHVMEIELLGRCIILYPRYQKAIDVTPD